MTNIVNKIKYKGLLLGALLIFLSMIPFSSAIGANVFNSASIDNPLRIGNNTQNSGTQDWQTSLTGVNAGDVLRFSVYFHNAGDIPATNTSVRVALSPTGSSTSFTATSTISAASFTNYVTTATIALTSSQSIQLSNTATLYSNYNGSSYQITSVPVSVSGSVITYNLGTVNQGYAPNDGYIIFTGTVSNTTTPITGTPSVNAGPNKTITSGQSTTLEATATHSSGLPMTYQWSCNGGTLSSSTTIQPTFYAPSVSSTQTYSCTIVARDTNNNTASSVVYITVNPISTPITGTPSVNAGPNKTIISGQSTTLEGTATHSSGLPMTYQWSCNGGNITNSTLLQPTFYAPSVSSTQTYSCTIVARDTNNNTASSVVYITVNPTYSGGGGYGYPVVNAGGNKDVTSGQSVSLSGTAYHPNGLYMTYQWSCNGGSLSNSTVLQPVFYAPSVSSTQTYSCTLTARDSNNNTASSVTYITVSPSYSGGGGNIPVVNAGGDRSVGGGQSITLEGTAYHPNNLYMTYQWSCNGGSLSYSSQLRPTFYAPSISYTTTYSCTLTARDGNNNSASSVAHITVNPSGYTGGGQGLIVSTNIAENVTSTTATLKGKIDNDYGRNVSIRFSWGTTSSQYNNYSPWQYNKRTGDIVSYNLTGLQKGKAYHYRIEASDGSRTIYGQNVSFVTKTDSVSGFSALASGSNRINLTWNNAPQSCYTMIVKKTGGYPQHAADGTVVYYGTGNSYLDTNISNNVWYYYKAWAVGCDQGLNSFSDSVQSRAYTVSGQVVPTTSTPVVTTVSSANVEILARNVSKDQFSWQNNITASKGDKIEFKIIITPMGNKSLESVKLITNFSDKITSIENLIVDGSTLYFDLNRETSFETIKLGESRVITFTGIMDSFSGQLTNSIDVSAKGIDNVRRDLFISIPSFEQGAAFADIFSGGTTYIWLFIILIILMALVMMYLILERNRILEKKEAEEIKVEKSKYFNIK